MSTAGMASVLAVLAVVTLLARRTAGGGRLARFRALVPAWRFFDRVTPSPYLLVRHRSPAGALGAWTSIHRGRRRRASWAFAAQDNLALAYQAAIEQLAFELGELGAESAESDAEVGTDPAVTGLVSYELVRRIAEAHVPAGATYQWKLVIPGEPDAGEPDDSLVSPELAA